MGWRMFFAKLCERLEIGRLTKSGRLVRLPDVGTPILVEHFLWWTLYDARLRLRDYKRRQRHRGPFRPAEMRWIRMYVGRQLWVEMRTALEDHSGYGPVIAERDYRSAEMAQELFLEAFVQLAGQGVLAQPAAPSPRRP